MKMVRSKLDDKREKKIKIDYNIVEQKIEEFLIKYNIDGEMEIFIQNKINNELNIDKAYLNIINKKGTSQPQVQVEFFTDIKKYLTSLINEKILLEIEYVKANDSEEKAEEIKEILNNTLEEIPLTMFDKGISRPTLTAYHYFLKVLHKNTEAYMEKNGIKKIRNVKNPNEIFSNEIYNIVGKDNELMRFTLTLKNLIENWLIKYSTKSQIGEFYYNILMITPETIIEKILKYLVMVAIRNKNPMTLRAIFSSYITLIHKNLFSYYSTNLSNVKVGYFKQLEELFTENFDLIFDDNEKRDSKKTITDIMIKTYLMKNKRYLKDDFEFLNNEYFQSFFETNYYDAITSYNYKTEFSLLDHMYFYETAYKYTKNHGDDGNAYGDEKNKLPVSLENTSVINSSFLKKNTKKKNILYIKEKLTKKLFRYFYNIFGDKESVLEILTKMAEDILTKLNFNLYLDENLNKLDLTFNEYLDNIDFFIDKIEKIILGDENEINNGSDQIQDLIPEKVI
jgi:hypothetical protein